MLKHLLKAITLVIGLVATHSTWATSEVVLRDIQGAWLGTMQIPEGPKLRIGVEIFEKADGSWGGNVASLDQNSRYIPVSSVKVQATELTVQLAGAPVSIKVIIDGEHNSMKGEFFEGSLAFPIELKRVESLPEIERVQTPVKNRPYLISEVSYKNKNDNVWLSGTLTAPQGDKKRPAVMLITGSGPAHRDEYFSGHRPFMVLADALTSKGFTVLRADKRGVFKSTGDYTTATQADFMNDIIAGVQFLKSHPLVDPNKVNIVGHSEGSLIAAMVAEKETVNSIVSMAGPGLTVLETILLQDQTEPAAKGASKIETDVLLGFSKRFYQAVLDSNNEQQRKKNSKVFMTTWQVKKQK